MKFNAWITSSFMTAAMALSVSASNAASFNTGYDRHPTPTPPTNPQYGTTYLGATYRSDYDRQVVSDIYVDSRAGAFRRLEFYGNGAPLGIDDLEIVLDNGEVGHYGRIGLNQQGSYFYVNFNGPRYVRSIRIVHRSQAGGYVTAFGIY